MNISITTGSYTSDQEEQVEKFLEGYLPKVRRLPGVAAVYHYAENGKATTMIIWRDKDALMAYRQGELVKSAIAFEKAHNLASTRDAYPLSISL